jgi:elongation factor P
MISPRDFKSGICVIIDGDLFQVVEAQHVKPGKGGAFVRTRLKNFKNGYTQERTCRVEERYEEAFIEEKPMQYLYREDAHYHFMDTETYEQIVLDKAALGESVKFLKENMDITASLYNHKIIGICLPIFVTLRIADTEPGIRGDTSKGGMKPATLETGAVIQVPLFVDKDALVRIDTRTGEYVERA